jgi:hypothetical protein
MKTLIAIVTALAFLAPSVANAGKYTNGGKGKVTTCSTSNSYFGSKTVCRTK